MLQKVWKWKKVYSTKKLEAHDFKNEKTNAIMLEKWWNWKKIESIETLKSASF